MEWLTSLKESIEYMEQNLLEDISVAEVADAVHISPFYFQKGFKVMTGVTVSEYIRNRRLYLAALDLLANKTKIIDLAYKYGYDTPESFSKAFSRFHGVSPAQIRGDSRRIKPYLPLKITISIQGGANMDYVVEKMKAFQMIGFKKRFLYDNSYEFIPKFWDEFAAKYMQGNGPEKQQAAVNRCCIGEYGVCISDPSDTEGFDYMIAGSYDGGEVPEGMEVYTIPEFLWAKFRCIGPMPAALQAVNTQIFQDWLPGNREYEMAEPINIEWYSEMNGDSAEYESGIWLPVKKK